MKYYDQEQIDRTKESIKLFNIKNGREIIERYNKANVLQLADVFEKIFEVSVSEFGINRLYHKSLPGTTLSNGLNIQKLI